MLNQTDEKDLGYSYKEIDAVLKAWYDEGLSFESLSDKFDKNLVNFIKNMVRKNSFKLNMPEIAMIRRDSARNTIF